MKCIVCGNNSWRYLFNARDRMFGLRGKFAEYRCTVCGLVRLGPTLRQAQLKYYYPSASYYSYRKKVNPDFFSSMRRFLIRRTYRRDIISRIIDLFLRVPAMPTPTPGIILDVGCGNGETLAILESVGWTAYGLDIDRRAINVAKERGLTRVAVGSYKDIRKFSDNFFDAIRLYHVIEHLDDPALALELMYKKLKKGGQLIIGTSNTRSLLAKLAGTYWYNLDAPRHLYVFNPKNLSSLVRKHAFRGINVQYSSVAGWVGSLQYVLQNFVSKNINLINQLWLILLFYPFERVLDTLGQGDIFILTATK